jgi:hypothetical protein
MTPPGANEPEQPHDPPHWIASTTASLMYPASHAQSVSSSLPAAELECEGHAVQLPSPAVAVYVPAGHVSHVAFPTALLNVPASHALHATPSEAAVYPGRHVQSASL